MLRRSVSRVWCKPTDRLWFAALSRLLPRSRWSVTRLPDEQQRQLYDAFHLEVRYDQPANTLTLRVTISAETAPALADTARHIAGIPRMPRAWLWRGWARVQKSTTAGFMRMQLTWTPLSRFESVVIRQLHCGPVSRKGRGR